MTNQDNYSGLEIAIIGMAGRFPGAKNINEFWKNLINGVESIEHLNDEDLIKAGVSKELLNDKNYVKAGSFLKDKEYFDAAFFNYTPADAMLMAPHIRVFLETTWEAFEDAGYVPDDYDGRIGIYAGSISSGSWEESKRNQALNHHDSYFATTMISSALISSHVSYKLNLRGPSVSLDTACATSNVAVHLACQALLSGECEMSIAGGVTLLHADKSGYEFRDGHILSSDGHVRTFDEKADGSVLGEGVGVVVLKTLEDALIDGDNIYSIIRGSAINNDGKQKIGFTAPSLLGQTNVIQDAMDAADVVPQDISYIETHGTATQMGDTIEVEALKKVFENCEEHTCKLGAVKTNIGHIINASGVAGLIKTSLALKNKMIPPSINFEIPNPKLKIDQSPFEINTSLTKWEDDNSPLRAGVSSFGVGGTNSHIIMEEAPCEIPSSQNRDNQLLLLSARTEKVLQDVSSNLVEYLKNNKNDSLADIAYTLQTGRKVFEHKKMLACSTIEEAIDKLSSSDNRKVRLQATTGENNRIVFMFSGLGSQYVNMGLDLYNNEEIFKSEADICFGILHSNFGLDIKSILYPIGDEEKVLAEKEINQFENSQLALFIIEYSLAKLIMKWGIKPDAVIGYSFGEYVAACISDVMSLEKVLELIVIRGEILKKVENGLMLSIPLSENELKPLLNDKLSFAIDNGGSCIVAGVVKEVEEFEKRMKEKKILTFRVSNSHAIHSYLMDSILDEFEQKISKFNYNEAKIPYVSNVTGDYVSGSDINSKYWAEHIRKTVLFSKGIKKITDNSNDIFIEIGPGRNLTSMLTSMLDRAEFIYATNLLRYSDDNTKDSLYLLNRLGELWLNGQQINWDGYYSSEQRKRVSLPTYPFEKNRFWIDDELENHIKAYIPSKGTGKIKNINEWFYIPSWKRSYIQTADLQKKETINYLIFQDNIGVGSSLIERLQKDGCNVIMINEGENYERVGDNEFIFDYKNVESYPSLFKQLEKENRIPDNIVHLWSLNENCDSSLSFEDYQYRGLYSLIMMCQSLRKVKFTKDIKLSVITDSLQDVLGNEDLRTKNSPIIGVLKVIPQEFPFIKACNIDVDYQNQNEGVKFRGLDHIYREIVSTSKDPIVVYRNNHRYLQTYEQIQLGKDYSIGSPKYDKGTFLIIGGLGRLGFSLSKYLAEESNVKLVLTGLTPLPPRESWDKILKGGKDGYDKVKVKIERIIELEKLGGEITYLVADASNEMQMKKILGDTHREYGNITGIIYAAGILHDRSFMTSIENTDIDVIKDHFKSKIYGIEVLESLLEAKEPDFVLVISSLSSILGGIGLASYAATSQYLDTFVKQHNQKSKIQWLNLNWGHWDFSEMVQELSYYEKKESELGLLPAEGIETFKLILKHKISGHVIISPGELNDRVDTWVNLNGEKVYDNEPGTPKAMLARAILASEYVAPQTQEEIIMTEIWESMFGYDEIGVQDNFFELGGNSLKAITILNKVKSTFGISILIADFFNNPSIKGLVSIINTFNNSETNDNKILKNSEDIII